MGSFQQQWETAMTGGPKRPARSPIRHAVTLLAIALVLIAAPTIALARATESHAPVHGCGVVQKTVGVVEQGGVGCTQARRIALRWLSGHNHPSGFSCHRKTTHAGSGFQGVCTDGSKRVTIIPQ